ncbi:hypothetical protein CALCODRAFT_481971 [Calocera cornea HHB12733]|uniref:C2H2-type domain-containing protein n=1 Tax=Calocera cornea HHB12733 TaxID=1353952 RepID=A0A165H4W7_9BASI|nr:hypothetical protein CALCODRAFT_481971 [Calocera cornea HHB12733]
MRPFYVLFLMSDAFGVTHVVRTSHTARRVLNSTLSFRQLVHSAAINATITLAAGTRPIARTPRLRHLARNISNDAQTGDLCDGEWIVFDLTRGGRPKPRRIINIESASAALDEPAIRDDLEAGEPKARFSAADAGSGAGLGRASVYPGQVAPPEAHTFAPLSPSPSFHHHPPLPTLSPPLSFALPRSALPSLPRSRPQRPRSPSPHAAPRPSLASPASPVRPVPLVQRASPSPPTARPPPRYAPGMPPRPTPHTPAPRLISPYAAPAAPLASTPAPTDIELEKDLEAAFRWGCLECVWRLGSGKGKVLECGRRYESLAKLMQHIAKAHCVPMPAATEAKRGTASRPTKNFQCRWSGCGNVKFATADDLYGHVEEEHAVGLLYTPCAYPGCRKKAKDLPTALRHIRRDHLDLGHGRPAPPPRMPPTANVGPLPETVMAWELGVQAFASSTPVGPAPRIQEDGIMASDDEDLSDDDEGNESDETARPRSTTPKAPTSPAPTAAPTPQLEAAHGRTMPRAPHPLPPRPVTVASTSMGAGFGDPSTHPALHFARIPDGYWTAQRTGPTTLQYAQEQYHERRGERSTIPTPPPRSRSGTSIGMPRTSRRAIAGASRLHTPRSTPANRATTSSPATSPLTTPPSSEPNSPAAKRARYLN